MQEKTENKCETCKYFFRYYIEKLDGFKPMRAGFCENEQRPLKQSIRLVAEDFCCELWEQRELRIAERQKNLYNLLNR